VFYGGAILISFGVPFLVSGCMLCLGRSNYFRFNHPREARHIKEALPPERQRISVTPVGFIPGKYEHYWSVCVCVCVCLLVTDRRFAYGLRACVLQSIKHSCCVASSVAIWKMKHLSSIDQ